VAADKFYLVGENGPELFHSNQAGRIVPQGGRLGATPTLAAQGASAQQPLSIVLQVTAGEMFDARVQSVSAPIAVEVVRQSAPGIVRAASAETMRRASRPRLG
jgi:hypothetical protein